ncbi:MAG: M23 family metallopeptidase, partial [Candidatus Andersenbacteria bacterium]
MTKHGLLTVLGMCLAVLVLAVIFWPRPSVAPTQETPLSSPSRPNPLGTPLSPSPTPDTFASATPTDNLVEPIAEFKERVTKKSFGTYVTPQDSPVQPEKFTGYHTGVDVEYDDVLDDVPVRAIADGEVVVARVAQGYGGVMLIKHTIAGEERLVVYGHLKPDNLRRVRSTVKAGEEIGVLGAGGTAETDGER